MHLQAFLTYSHGSIALVPLLKTILTLSNPRFLELRINPLKLANPIVSCILLQMAEVFWVRLEMHGQSILLLSMALSHAINNTWYLFLSQLSS